MFQGFAYISKHGVLEKKDYKQFHQSAGRCAATQEIRDEKGHLRNIGYVEHDGRTNSQLRDILMEHPISMSMYTTGMLGAYKTGVVTEEFLHCSYPNLEVNHGVVMVGYGKV